MDGDFLNKACQRKTVAFLTWHQSMLYGGYDAAAKALKVDFILHPDNVGTYWPDMDHVEFNEIGHG